MSAKRDIDELTLWERVFQSSEGYEGTALTFSFLKVSYPKLKKRIVQVSERLKTLGIEAGDVVCLCAPNIPQAVYCLYALNRIGAIAFIVHPLFPAETLNEDLIRAKAKLMLVIDQRLTAYQGTVTACPIVTISPKDDLPLVAKPFYRLIYHKQLRGVSDRRRLGRVKRTALTSLNRDSLKPSVYLESGGTTGRSKIVVLNDRAISYPGGLALYILEKDAEVAKGTAMIGALPMFHGFGLAMGVHAPLINCATSALMISYDLKDIIKHLKKGKLNYLLTIPYAARKLLDNPEFSGPKLRCLSHAFIGADKPPRPLFDEWNQRMRESGADCPLLEGYGLTETTTVIAVNRRSTCRVGSVGQPLPGTRIRVVDPQGHILPADAEGEIQIATPAMMLGYLDDPETTAKALIKDEEGTTWLATGDQGHLDEDGYIYFKDRLKNVFKIAGHNVFPNDIESAVSKNPSVAACAAIPVPDERHPYMHLFIEMRRNVDTEIALRVIKAELNSRLIRYEVPEVIEVIDRMPRTNVGKIDRKILSAQALKEMRK